MSKIRDYFISIPKVCGVSNSEAWGEMNRLAFDHEIANPGSVFSRLDTVSVEERLLPAFGFMVCPSVSKDSAEYAIKLATLASMAYGLTKGIGDKLDVSRLTEEVKMLEPWYPQVSNLLTVDEASTLTVWD